MFTNTAKKTFLSTPSARRATYLLSLTFTDNEISIHALREEGDCRTEHQPIHQRYFYPRPPRGGRRTRGIMLDAPSIFLSTPSARRAT